MPRIGIGSKLNNTSKLSLVDTSDYKKVRLDPKNLIPSDQNFYSTDSIEELADNMLMVGQLQEIVIGRVDGEDRVIVGHRRRLAGIMNQERGYEQFNEMDCKVKEMNETMFMLTLLSANAFNRTRSDWELVEEARLFKVYLTKAKEEGMKIPGKMRSYIAGMMNVSDGKMGQIEKINNSLCEEGKEALKKGNITFDKAYNTARLPQEEQKNIIENKSMLSKDVKSLVDAKNGKEKEQAAVEEEDSSANETVSESDTEWNREIDCENYIATDTKDQVGSIEVIKEQEELKYEPIMQVSFDDKGLQAVDDNEEAEQSVPEQLVASEIKCLADQVLKDLMNVSDLLLESEVNSIQDIYVTCLKRSLS